ncbi:MAG: Ig-like domain-containing protein [Cyclobacteriaceae bacterium]
MKKLSILFLFFGTLLLSSCGDDGSENSPKLEIILSTLNGSNIALANPDIPSEVTIVLVFSGSVDPTAFENLFSLSTGGSKADYSIAYANAAGKVTVTATLDYATTYTVNLGTEVIGANGERLAKPLNFSFTTSADSVIRSMAPCTSVGDCLRNVTLQGSAGNGVFQFYSNYPIFEENAAWENLTHAVIVVHGASHDPDDYYTFMTNTFQSESHSESTILIAPFFRNTATESSDDFYWPNTDWRRGSPSSNSNRLSSFEALDALIDQLATKDHFPVLEKIIVTGHSSGAAFTQVYSASNRSELNYPEIDFEYVVANSQYFYYPNNQRINESSNQLYTPTGCTGYNIWPLGYSATPAYLSNINSETYNGQFINRSITYLLGNGSQSDPTLNTTNCENTLQGSSRYKRGENMYRFMELTYPGTHNHKRVIVNGIGHDGQGMYQSSEFKTFLKQLVK